MTSIGPRSGAPLALTAVLALTACGGGDGATAKCGPVQEERLDPDWTLHLIPGATWPDYLTDPPTSGPHLSGAAPEGIQSEPLDQPSQVSVLEGGGVLVQYRPDAVDGADRGRLERLVAPGVVVAPEPSLPAVVMATAWLKKQTCDGVDIEVLTRFVADEGGNGPGTS